MIRHQIKFSLVSVVLIFLIAFSNACSTKSGGLQSNLDPDKKGQGQLGPNAGGGAGGFNLPPSGAIPPSLPPDDQAGLRKLEQNIDQIFPETLEPMNTEQQQQLQFILAKSKAGQAVNAEVYQLAAQVLSACFKRVSELSPKPGEPLQGLWAGACEAKFMVHGKGQRVVKDYSAGNITFKALSTDGKVSGVVTPNADGTAIGKGNDGWSASFSDQPQAGTGLVKHGSKCSGPIALLISSNRIPEKFRESVKLAAECYRKANIIVSGVLSEPKLAPYFFSQLGVK